MAHPYQSAGHRSDPKWLGRVRKYADGGSVDDGVPSWLKVENRDYSKQPASVAEKIVGAAKIAAQPAAQTISKAYRRISGE